MVCMEIIIKHNHVGQHFGRTGNWKTLNVVWEEGETMDVVMYFRKGDGKHFSLGYQTNDKIENAFDDLDVNLTYRFAAAVWEQFTSISFV